MAGLSAAPPFNRAVVTAAEFGSAKILVLDSILVQFDANTSLEERQTFQDQVPITESSIAKACVGWLERDVPRNLQSKVAPVIAAQ